MSLAKWKALDSHSPEITVGVIMMLQALFSCLLDLHYPVQTFSHYPFWGRLPTEALKKNHTE